MPTLKNLFVILLVSFQFPSVMAATEFEDSIPLEVAAALFDNCMLAAFFVLFLRLQIQFVVF